MKKLLKLNLFLTSPLLISSFAISCSPQIQEQEKSSLGDQVLENMSKIFINYDKEQPQEAQRLLKEFVKSQELVSETRFEELDYALSFFAPYNIEEQSRIEEDYSRIIGKSNKLVQDLFRFNWYWYLRNLDRMIFNFNPYGDRFQDIPISQSKIDMNKVIEELFESNKLTINPKNNINKALTFYQYNWSTFEKELGGEFLLSKNRYAQVDYSFGLFANYLQIEQDLYLRYWNYKDKNGNSTLVMLPDLFYIPNSNKQIIDEFEKNIYLTRDANVKQRIEYQKEAEIYEEDVFEKESNDTYFFKLFERRSYNLALYETLLKTNADGMKIYRYTFRRVK